MAVTTFDYNGQVPTWLLVKYYLYKISILFTKWSFSTTNFPYCNMNAFICDYFSNGLEAGYICKVEELETLK